MPAGDCVHIEDRGYQLADAVYEAWSVLDGRLADARGAPGRGWSAACTNSRIDAPMSRKALLIVLHEAVRRNRVRDGLLYLQVGRGVAPRDHAFPTKPVRPSVVITAKSVDPAAAEARAAKGIGVVTTPENRWGRCDIKTVGLLPNAMAKQKAKEAGAGEAWFVDDLGLVTEGASSNAWIVDAEGRLRTRDTNANILRGITRTTLFGRHLSETGWKVDERPFTVADALGGPRSLHHQRRRLVHAGGSLSTEGKPVATASRAGGDASFGRLYIERAQSHSHLIADHTRAI
jgi:D-alanine transaminase